MKAPTHAVLSSWGSNSPQWSSATVTEHIVHICRSVCESSGIHPSALFLHRRGPARIAHTRQLVMAIIRETTDLSLAEIGSIFAGRDHGTVIFACKAVRRRCKDFAAIATIYPSHLSRN